jgi:RimJ/RimL family protein N-acetyltransferase
LDPYDAEFVCGLRSDPDLNEHLSSAPADVQAQREWLVSYKKREVQGQEFYFAIRCDGKDVGVVRLYDLKLIEGLRSFSWGSWIILPPRAPGIVTYSAVMMYELGFSVLGFERAHFEVMKANSGVIAFHKRAGAVLESTQPDRFEFGFFPAAWHSFRDASQSQIADHRR